MQKTCANSWCKATFEVTNDDLAFYDKVSPVIGGKKFIVPPPTLCPKCRRQRKLAWRNERTLYERKCDFCQKDIVSVHSPRNSYPVYCNPCWWSDRWDPHAYGREIDFGRSFFEQYAELYQAVPQRAMVNDDGVTSENCAYTTDVAFAKNCYLCFGMWKCQDCCYCRICDQSRFCFDCEGVKLGSELVYESTDSQHLHHCAFLQNSENCRDCYFGYDLKGCTDCLACVGMRQKRYCVFNEPKSEQEYHRILASHELDKFTSVQRFHAQFRTFIERSPRKCMNLQNCESCTGDHLFHCRDVHECYVCTNMEHCKWIERSDGPIWCYEIIQAGDPQLCYECITVDNGYMIGFSLFCNQSRDVLYSDNCLSCSNLFGCISLRRKQFCVLNKQYSKEKYEQLVGAILETMQKSNEHGNFFPVQLSPYGYNETNAQEFFPLTKKEVEKRGWKWREQKDEMPKVDRVIPAEKLPDSIDAIPDDILNWAITCEATKRPFRIIRQELEFYRKMKLPVPHLHPDERHRRRMALRNSHSLWKRTCGKCGKEIQTTYSPNRPETVYCEQCYLAAVY